MKTMSADIKITTATPLEDISHWLKSGLGAVLLVTSLWTGNVLAQAFESTQSKYGGAEAGSWGGPEGGVTGPADGICRNMGAVGKISLLNTFGFAIPADATITDVRAQVKAGENDGQDVAIALASDATAEPPVLVGDIQSFFAPASGGDCSSTVVVEVGGDVNTFWNTAGGLTPAIVNSPAFGLAMTKTQTSSVKVDAVCLEIDYTTPGGPATQELCFDATPDTASLTIVKTVEGSAPVADWDFSRTNPPVNFTLPAAGGQTAYPSLPAGTYDITETLKPGYSAVVQCGEAADPSTPIGTPIGDGETTIGQSVTLAAGEVVSCVFVNTQITSFTVTKDFTDDSTGPVDITLTCSDGTITTNPLPATDSEPAVFEITGAEDPGAVTCTAVESGLPGGYTPDNSDCQDGDALGTGCTILNTPVEAPPSGAAYFRVEKEFMDGNDITPASFRIDCNTGLILDQTKTADIRPGSEGAPDTFEVEFVVTDFTQGAMTCTVSEDPVVAGYTPSYFCDSNTLAVCDTGDPSDLDEFFEGPCVYNNVDTTEIVDDSEPYQHLCVIRNYPNPVPVVINKTWEITGSETHEIDPWYRLTLSCQNEIITEGAVDNGDGNWSIDFYNDSGTSDAQYSAMVIPDWDGGTSCEVHESLFDGSVEVENGCHNLLAQLADGDECTITNTVFYEGIPTLNQYGMAILALLMLGVGMVGFRRFG
jgi:hypothetical protein